MFIYLSVLLFEGIPLTSASYFATMTLEQVRHVFRSDTDAPMPLIEERHRVLHETGTVLLEKFGGSFLTCVKKSEKSAQKLLQIIVENFPSFRDEATFQVSDLCLVLLNILRLVYCEIGGLSFFKKKNKSYFIQNMPIKFFVLIKQIVF